MAGQIGRLIYNQTCTGANAAMLLHRRFVGITRLSVIASVSEAIQ
jgi:hypothetical protein